jgi:hypothetical protein
MYGVLAVTLALSCEASFTACFCHCLWPFLVTLVSGLYTDGLSLNFREIQPQPEKKYKQRHKTLF